MRWNLLAGLGLGILCASAALMGCGGGGAGSGGTTTAESKGGEPAAEPQKLPIKPDNIKADLAGTIEIDGSSTVFKISQMAAEIFGRKASKVELSVGYVGTGGGFTRFPDPSKKLDICDASRPISQKELDDCASHGVKFLELPIGIDAITIIVSTKNDFLKEITVAELQKLWAPGSSGAGEVKKWSAVNKAWPDEPVALFGADSKSGTFEYFNEAVHHDKKKTRSDYTANPNDNILIQGVEKNKFALGYVPYAYFTPRQNKTLRAVKVKLKDDSPAVEPTPTTISSGEYHPFARPLFIYVNAKSLERPEVANFVGFYLDNAGALCHNAGYIAFEAPIYAKVRERFDKRELGTAFGGTLKEDMNLTTIMDLPVKAAE